MAQFLPINTTASPVQIRRNMTIIPWHKLAITLVIMIGGISTTYAQSATDKLEVLVETSARRLAMARQIALAKWDARSQVEDAAREADVIAAAVNAGRSRGLDREVVSNFFRAQIEANKLVQYSLLASWHREGPAPYHPPIDLATVREKLDCVQEDLLGELAETTERRRGTTCRVDTAKAVGKYISTHKLDDPLLTIALDRAMAATCIS
jgi:chorismate mutase